MLPHLRFLLVFYLLLGTSSADASWSQLREKWVLPPATGRSQVWPDVYLQEPPLSPDYMVDNTDDNHGVAPINGKYNGPVWAHSGSFENYMKMLQEKKASGLLSNTTAQPQKRQSGYWLPELAKLGQAPLAGERYVFYRNVLDYGADNTGASDTVEAINAAIMDGDRCGAECGNTFVQGAVVYFPPGIYKICTPIIQLYYTQFISDPHDRAVIKGCDEFTGIALVDVDPYVPNQAQPDGTGVNWYVNQNQFFRQIRNFVFDLMEMPPATDEHGQKLVPTGLHWQVSQATSLQNLLFKMPTAANAGENLTHVGIFTENGSGGFVSDLEFEGGAIGWRVGSQQYTAIGLKFTNCVTAVQMIWDWGFNWQRIEVNGGTVAFNISGRGGIDGQGIGSVSIIDSIISNTPIGILTNAHETMAPNIVIDNTDFSNVGAIVQVADGDVLLAGGSQKIDLWAHGLRYNAGDGSRETGAVEGRPSMPSEMLDGGKLFTRSRPQYEDFGIGSFLIATEHGCTNDATGDNTDAINSFLQQAASSGMIAYFPAGIYLIKSTVTIPAGSKVQGTSWSQIQATGDYFNDIENPKVAVRVGEAGDVGTMEIVEMLFTVKGPTAGAIMVEWNIKASSPGAAGLWDSHIRVGGGIGTDLDQATCPKLSFNEACITASLLLHVTEDASGYFENFWAWTADHDNDYSLYFEVDSTVSQISLYSARGVLIESQDPVWIYGSGSEHTILYQYETYKAKNVYLGHIQTESPYYQPQPVAPMPFDSSVGLFHGDPDFSSCEDDGCKEAWGLRIIDSESITVHSAGLYSWFDNYGQACVKQENCQSRIMEVKGSKSVAIYNIFSKGVVELATGEGYTISGKDAQQGYTTEISVWFPADGNPEDDLEVVYIGTEVYTSHTAQCTASGCVLVIAPTPLPSSTTISFPPFTVPLQVGHSTSSGGRSTFVVTTTTVTITVTPLTTNQIPVSNVNVTKGETAGSVFQPRISINLPPIGVPLTNQDGQVTTRNVTLPPWPLVTGTSGGGSTSSSNDDGWGDTTDDPSNIPETTESPTTTDPLSTHTKPPYVIACPPSTFYVREESATITLGGCVDATTTLAWDCPATTTVSIDENTDVDFTLGCTHWTGTATDTPPSQITWPPGTLEWVEEDGDDDDDDHTSTCKLWFFWICISWGNVRIGGWRWNFPEGILPPGPPPNIKWPPSVTLTGKLPGPWPPITIGPGGKVTYPTNEPTSCTTETAELCSTSTSFGVTVSDGTSKTTTTATISSTCTTIFGCHVSDSDESSSTTEIDSCTLDVARKNLPTLATDTVTINSYSQPATATAAPSNNAQKRAPSSPPLDQRDHAIIFPQDPFNADSILDYLASHRASDDEQYYGNTAKQIATTYLKTRDSSGNLLDAPRTVQFTAFFFVKNMLKCHIDQLNQKAYVAEAYGQYAHNQAHYQGRSSSNPVEETWPVENFTQATSTAFGKRAELELVTQKDYWELSQIAIPPNYSWKQRARAVSKLFRWNADDSFGMGQTIYICEDDIEPNHLEFGVNVDIFDEFLQKVVYDFRRTPIRRTTPFDYGSVEHQGPALSQHGTNVVSKAYGAQLGLAKKAEIVVVRNFNGDPPDKNNLIQERYLESLIQVLADIKDTDEGDRGKFIVSMSWGWLNHESHAYMKRAHFDILYLLLRELDLKGVVLVCAAHNDYYARGQRNSLDGWPSRFGDPSESEQKLDNLIVVGGTDIRGRIMPISPWADWLIMAPGWQVWCASGGSFTAIAKDNGNSLGAPMVASLVAYWRGLPNKANNWEEELRDPANVKKLLRFMQREILESGIPKALAADLGDYPPKQPKPLIWTGWYDGGNCLQNPDPGAGCPQGSLSDLEPGGSCPARRKRQDGGGSCDLPGSGGGDDGGVIGAVGEPVTWQPGPASPTCEGGCGTLCTGYYCLPTPTGHPPDYYDPLDPAHTTKPTTTPITTTPTSSESLPPLPTTGTDPYTGSGCDSYTTSEVCNGSGGHTACVTQALCVPTKPCIPTFSPSGSPICTNDDEFCLRTTVFTRCARGNQTPTNDLLPRAEETAAYTHQVVTSTFVTVQTPEASAQRETSNVQQVDSPVHPKQTPVPVLEQETQPESSINPSAVELLFPRQNDCGGSANGGCDYLLFCAVCATLVEVPCLEANIHAITGGLSGTDATAQIFEDGVLVCEASLNCAIFDTECGIAEYDCGDGNSIVTWQTNYILYASKKYDMNFPMYLDRTRTDELEFCFQGRLPAACLIDDFAYQDGPCDS